MRFFSSLFGGPKGADRKQSASRKKRAPHEGVAKCPSCGHELEKFPRARRKCPACKKWIHRHVDRAGNLVRLVTEQQAQEHKWSELNALLETTKKSGSKHDVAGVLRLHALEVFKEGRDHLALAQKAQRTQILASWPPGGIIGRLRIIGCADSCPACQEVIGKVFTVEEALKEMPIPPKNCTGSTKRPEQHGWCRCCWVPEIDD